MCYYSPMQRKVRAIIEEIVQIIQKWETIDTAALAEFAETEVYDPYFFISLDIYHDGEIPPFEARKKVFRDAAVFESSKARQKDRFLWEGLPVRLEYKEKAYVEDIIVNYGIYEAFYRRIGTYPFYRLNTSDVVFNRTDWMESIRSSLEELPVEFWTFLADVGQKTIEHSLADLQAAALAGDEYFFIQSLAGFLTSVSRLLFAVNRRFEPSGRTMGKAVSELGILPENFRGRYSSLLRQDSGLDLQRKAEVAELLTRSLLPLQQVLV